MAMLAIGADDCIIWLQDCYYSCGYGLFANVEMEKAANFARAIKLGAFFLEPPDTHHLAQQAQAVIAAERRLRSLNQQSHCVSSPSSRLSNRFRASRYRPRA